MSSPIPISIWKNVCSNCWKKLNPKTMIFLRRVKDIHWACSEKCLKELVEDYLENENLH